MKKQFFSLVIVTSVLLQPAYSSDESKRSAVVATSYFGQIVDSLREHSSAAFNRFADVLAQSGTYQWLTKGYSHELDAVWNFVRKHSNAKYVIDFETRNGAILTSEVKNLEQSGSGYVFFDHVKDLPEKVSSISYQVDVFVGRKKIFSASVSAKTRAELYRKLNKKFEEFRR